MRRGEACASVVPVPQSYADGCLQMAALLGRAAWLQHAGSGGSAPSVEAALTAAARGDPAGGHTRLALTRMRDELGGIALHYDACPDLAGLGRLAPAAKP